MLNNISNKLKEIDLSILKAEEYKAKIIFLSEEFSDLDIYVSRWKTEYLISKLVLPLANNCDIRYSCGCCDDAPLMVSPYIIYNGHKVYSNPMEIYIGNKNHNYGAVESTDWKNQLKKYNINDKIIDIVDKYFIENYDPSEDESE